MSDDTGISITTELTRGTGTDDRDKIKATVDAADVDELDDKLGQVRERLEQWADEMREIQPDGREGGRRLADDQTGLDEVEA